MRKKVASVFDQRTMFVDTAIGEELLNTNAKSHLTFKRHSTPGKCYSRLERAAGSHAAVPQREALDGAVVLQAAAAAPGSRPSSCSPARASA